MFKKALIAEDADFMSSGIKSALKSIKIPVIEYAKYCDEAFLKLKNAMLINEPFDLLISDLSFLENLNPQRLSCGEDLIKETKELQPSIKTIIFSVEDKAHRVQNLCDVLKIDAYVSKHVNGERELKEAIPIVFNNGFFISPRLKPALQVKEDFEITDYDVSLLLYLSKGLEQKDISEKLKTKKISPSSISSIEKRLKLLKENFNANNPTQLIAITKDFGLI